MSKNFQSFYFVRNTAKASTLPPVYRKGLKTTRDSLAVQQLRCAYV